MADAFAEWLRKGFKPRNIGEFLSRKYGGKWGYDRSGSCWHEEQSGRFVRAVASLDDDEYGRPSIPCYYIYGGERTELVDWGEP